jgi:transposase
VILARQDEHETLETFFKNVDLSFAYSLIRQCFHATGPGRPPRNPKGLFRAFLIMRMKAIRSLREMTRILNADSRTRKLCLIKDNQKGYTRSVMSRFSKRVGQNNLNKIIDQKVIKLLKTQQSNEVDLVLDASFIKAWSIRHPTDNQIGYSDTQARVGRSGRSFALGYKMHLSIDHKTMLPLSNVIASANQNEKRHSLTLLEKAKGILKRCKARVRSVVADSQYSDSKLRSAVDKATIPYPVNQGKDVEGLLRVDKKFRTYGSEEDKTEYHKRPPIEAVNSFLKTQFSMANNKVRGLFQVTFYALCSILCLVLNREAAQNIGRHEKAVSPTYFNT